MSDLGETFRLYREERRKKKLMNHCNSLDVLRAHGVMVEILSEHHYRIGKFDFWPSTGKWLDRETGKYSRGITKLLIAIKRSA
ncbi:MAG: hypothetical protein E6Q97_32940 [Desulfurellales bacterium]|jgi:hypothetical protein|nr:MAG: hypothetical protein E6Q97_32940 [Desulfurellales bacterium]